MNKMRFFSYHLIFFLVVILSRECKILAHNYESIHISEFERQEIINNKHSEYLHVRYGKEKKEAPLAIGARASIVLFL